MTDPADRIRRRRHPLLIATYSIILGIIVLREKSLQPSMYSLGTSNRQQLWKREEVGAQEGKNSRQKMG